MSSGPVMRAIIVNNLSNAYSISCFWLVTYISALGLWPFVTQIIIQFSSKTSIGIIYIFFKEQHPIMLRQLNKSCFMGLNSPLFSPYLSSHFVQFPTSFPSHRAINNNFLYCSKQINFLLDLDVLVSIWVRLRFFTFSLKRRPDDRFFYVLRCLEH